jgi:hypothetical protein
MKWRALYWLVVLVVAVAGFITVLVLAPGDRSNCRYEPNAQGCDAGTDLGAGLIAAMTGFVLLAWWVERIARWLWRKWQQRGPTYI